MEDKKNVPDSDLDKISGGTDPDKQSGSWQQGGGSGADPIPDNVERKP